MGRYIKMSNSFNVLFLSAFYCDEFLHYLLLVLYFFSLDKGLIISKFNKN